MLIRNITNSWEFQVLTHLLDSVVGEAVQHGVEDDRGHGEEVAGGEDDQQLVLVRGGAGIDHGGDVEGDVEDVDGGPADEEDHADPHQDVVCPLPPRYLSCCSNIVFAGLKGGKWLADFVIDEANKDAGDEVLDKETDDGVCEMMADMTPVLVIRIINLLWK